MTPKASTNGKDWCLNCTLSGFQQQKIVKLGKNARPKKMTMGNLRTYFFGKQRGEITGTNAGSWMDER